MISSTTRIMWSNRTIVTIACHRDKMRVRNAISTYRHVHITARYVNSAFRNEIITAFGWIAVLANRIIVYSCWAVAWERFLFCSAQTYRWLPFAIHFLCFDYSASIFWCRTIVAKFTISMSKFYNKTQQTAHKWIQKLKFLIIFFLLF